MHAIRKTQRTPTESMTNWERRPPTTASF